MKPNPGGILTGEAIIDREKEISTMWNALKKQSVVLVSERRVEKSSILRKMEEHPQDNWQPILYWIEGKEHPVEFVQGLYEEFLKKGIARDRFHKLKQFYMKYAEGEQIGNFNLPKIKNNWKSLLDSMLQDIHDSDAKVLIMLDELPLMLSKFIKDNDIGPIKTMGFLDTLRELRNKYEASKKISFIFSGSIGINLIIKDLKKKYGYNADPINNMKIIPISSMDEQGALLLCEKLSEDAPFIINDKNKIFNYICQNTDNLPFYMQHVFDYFYEAGIKTISEKDIDNFIQKIINDPHDAGLFRQYTERIDTYYDEEQKNVTFIILNKACHKTGFWKEDDIINHINTMMTSNEEHIKKTLELLWSDHYLVREIKNNKRAYKFRYSILQKWWKVNRG